MVFFKDGTEYSYSELNSNIYKNSHDRYIFDLTSIGTVVREDETIEIYQENHFFRVADALYYDIKNHKFDMALAENTIMSEVCGVVSEIIDRNTFRIIVNGHIQTDRYSFDVNTPLYLSDAIGGKLVSIAPGNVIKQVATQVSGGIMVDIQRGFIYNPNNSQEEEMEPYTKEELDEIIKNLW